MCLRKAENRDEQETYTLLKPGMQENFAMAWGQERDWKFLSEQKVMELVQEATEGKRRAWFTPKGLAKFIGGGQADEESEEHAGNWMQSCWNYNDETGAKWVDWSYGLRTYMFKYEWVIEKDDDIERNKVVTELSKSTNIFKQAALERVAVLNFCEKYGKKEGHDTVKEVTESKLGLQGWADAGTPQILRGDAKDKKEQGKKGRGAGAARSMTRRCSDASNAGTSDGYGDDERALDEVAPLKAKGKAKMKAKAKASGKLRATDVDKILSRFSIAK